MLNLRGHRDKPTAVVSVEVNNRNTMIIGACILELHLPSVRSLKEKRRHLRSLLTRLRNKFNLAVAEIGHNDVWKSAQIAIVSVSNEKVSSEKVVRSAVQWIEEYLPDLDVVSEVIEWR